MVDPTRQISEAPAAISCEADDGFKQWMSNYGGSIVFATRRSGKLCCLGWDGRMVTLLQRQMDLPTGVRVMRNQILVSTRTEITLFADAPLLAYGYAPDQPGGYDACYLPRAAWFVGDIAPGDVLTDQEGMMFISSRFSCAARPSFKYHFEPVWKPEFISEIVPEDRCRLSGAAAVDGKLAYVTAFGSSNTRCGWRELPNCSGILMDARTNEIILEGLNMPHSPRWYKECLWFLNSGAGELCVMNPETRETKTVCHLPGITRGLAFWGNHAVIGLSVLRQSEENGRFSIRKKNNSTFCGVVVVNILTGRVEGSFLFQTGCEEVSDLDLVPNAHRMAFLLPNQPKCMDALTMPEFSWWIQSER